LDTRKSQSKRQKEKAELKSKTKEFKTVFYKTDKKATAVLKPMQSKMSYLEYCLQISWIGSVV